MPLIKKGSKKAFDHNTKAEMDAGKPQDQSLAIAYEIQRKNKRKKMAKGGLIEVGHEEGHADKAPHPIGKPADAMDRISTMPPKPPRMESAKRDLDDASRIAAKMESDDEEFLRAKRTRTHNHNAPDQEHHFADGGFVDMPDEMSLDDAMDESRISASRRMSHNRNAADQEHHFYNGGVVDSPIDADERNMSMAEKILNRKAQKGEQSFIEMNGKEEPNYYYHRNEHDVLKDNADDDIMDVSQPMDSNEHGDDIESDAHDMVSKIRSKMRMKRGK